MTVKTRFAPSPTGYLHIGGARTALFAWLYARKHQGEFILRIEDTDRERSRPEFVQAILQGLQWLGLAPTQGPFYQTQRFDRYREVIEQLLAQGDAYRCDCSKERLETLREQQIAQKRKPKYDGHCRDRDDLDPGKPHVIRFKNPQQGSVVFEDLIKGRVEVRNSEIDDLVIARSDGTPTYNLTVVVDDYDMEITHVIRGDDHVNNTPRQINILRALGAALPDYAHVPMILGPDGKRLSKRHGAMSVTEFRDRGYLPEAVINYLVRLGWSHGDQEIFSRQEMIDLFALQDISRSAATYDVAKLEWFNQYYLKHSPFDAVAPALQQQCQRHGIDCNDGPALEAVFMLYRERVKTLEELALASVVFYRDEVDYDPKAAKKNLRPKALQPLQRLQQIFTSISWDKQVIHDSIKALVQELAVGFGQVALPLRVAVCGSTAAAAIDDMVYLIGRERVLLRLRKAIELIGRLDTEQRLQ